MGEIYQDLDSKTACVFLLLFLLTSREGCMETDLSVCGIENLERRHHPAAPITLLLHRGKVQQMRQFEQQCR